jgi:type I restriction enzyme M protein
LLSPHQTTFQRTCSEIPYGIELHDVVGRICKINLLLHHDGHTNIEANRSCLDSTFTKDRLNPPKERFTILVGNPPFGTDIKEGETDQLGENSLANFTISEGRQKIDSEQVILERSIELLEPGGRLGLVLPDGLLNNQGEISNCPATRRLMARSGFIEAIVSLPDYAFRKSGAQNKTSILFFRKFTEAQRRTFERAFTRATRTEKPESEATIEAILAAGLNYKVFLAEANHVGYTPAGQPSPENDLYRSSDVEPLTADQEGSILGEWRRFKAAEQEYPGRTSPDCMAVEFDELWRSHPSNRLDPKFHLFEREEERETPEGWITLPLGGPDGVMRRRSEVLSKVSANELHADAGDQEGLQAMAVRERPATYGRTTTDPDAEFKVMTVSQTGDIRERPAGKGNNPPRWMGTYFIDSPGSWYVARANDVVYSGIDLWKGCIAVVPPEFDGALVSKEFPIYEVTDRRLLPEFLQCLLRTRYYQRAFRAITTGHSNRRRTQEQDFESLRVSFPADPETQRQLIAEIQEARMQAKDAAVLLKRKMLALSNIIDGRGEEELPEIAPDEPAYFSDRGRLFQSDRGRRFNVIADDHRGARATG